MKDGYNKVVNDMLSWVKLNINNKNPKLVTNKKPISIKKKKNT